MSKTIKIIAFYCLILFVIISQSFLLKPHLNYGLSDVDWGFLFYYQEHKQNFPNLKDNLHQTFLRWGVYAHQQYYIGLQEQFFGMDFWRFQVTTHVFKILAVISSFFIFFVISNNFLASFLAVILFAFSYPAVGAMYTVVTSSDYLAILVMNFFLCLYWWLAKTKRNPGYLLVVMCLLFLTTMFLSTERMYPIFFWIVLAELWLLINNKFSKKYLASMYKRVCVIFIPVFYIAYFYPTIITNFLANNGVGLIEEIKAGNFQLFLYPFISLGSLIVPHDYWKYFGKVAVNDFQLYSQIFFQKQLIIFSITSLSIGLFLFRSMKLILVMLLSFSISSMVLFYLATVNKQTSLNPSFVVPALIGNFVLNLGVAVLGNWLKKDQNNMLQIGIFTGIFTAFMYILLTWLASESSLIFTGIHRYLTIPSEAISLSLGCILAVIVTRLWNFKGQLKVVTVIPIVLLIITIFIWSGEISYFFNDDLKKGFGAKDKQDMRSQLLNSTRTLDSKDKTLFYFDFTEDKGNGYYYDNTLLGGFSTWILWHKNINLDEKIRPYVFWNDFNRLKLARTEKDHRKGFFVFERFFPDSNFYAFRLKDKKVITITDQLIKELDYGSPP